MVAVWKLRTHENIIRNDLKEVFRIWIRKVDGIFAIASKSIDLPPLLAKLNSYDQNIQLRSREIKHPSIP